MPRDVVDLPGQITDGAGRVDQARFLLTDRPVAYQPESGAFRGVRACCGRQGQYAGGQACQKYLSESHFDQNPSHQYPYATLSARSFEYKKEYAGPALAAAGIDLAAAAEGFSTGATGSPHVVRHARYMAENKHEDPVQFWGRMRIKDMDYGIRLIESVGAQSLIGHATRNVIEQMVEHGTGDRNDSELIDALRVAHNKDSA